MVIIEDIISKIFMGNIVIIDNIIHKFIKHMRVNRMIIKNNRINTRFFFNPWFVSEFKWFTNKYRSEFSL